MIDHVAQIEGMGGQYLFMPGGGSLNPATHKTVDEKMHYIHQDGKNVFKYAVKKMAEMTERVLEKNKLTGKMSIASSPIRRTAGLLPLRRTG